MMLWRPVPALALTFVSTLLPAQAPTTNPPVTAATVREPELLPLQKAWPAQGKCERRRLEWARVRLDIAEDGAPLEIQPLDRSSDTAAELATQIVRADRFKPAEQDGKPVTVHEDILVEINACVDKVKQPNGKKTEQVWIDAEPKQTLYPGPRSTFQNPQPSRVGGHISAPVVINAPEALYSAEARKEHIEGEVMISLIVDADGMPRNPRVVRPMPAGLNEAALTAVMKYRFRPAMKDGKTPVPVMVTIAVDFRL